MPRSNWHGPYAAIALGAVLCFVIAYLSWNISASQTEIRVSRDQNANQHIEYAQDRIRQTCLDRDPTTYLECVTVEIISAQDHGRAESDLDAQQAMALWAKLMTVASVAGLGVTAIGVYLVWGTLDQTRAATNAAQDAVAVTRDIGQRQVRAYLVDLDVRVVGYTPGAIPTYHMIVKNTGQSPARSVRIAFCARHGAGDPNRIKFRNLIFTKSMDVPAGEAGPQEFTSSTPIDPAMHAQVVSGGIRIVVGGVFIYKDVFGKTCRTICRYTFDPTRPHAEGGFRMLVCGRNNRQT